MKGTHSQSALVEESIQPFNWGKSSAQNPAFLIKQQGGFGPYGLTS